MLLNIRPRDTSIGVNLKPAWNKLVGCHPEKNLFSESNHPHVPYSCLWASVRVGDAKALMLVERPLLWYSYNHSVTMPHPQSLSCESPILKSGFCFSLCMYYTLLQARSGSSNEMWVASDKAFRIFLAKIDLTGNIFTYMSGAWFASEIRGNQTVVIRLYVSVERLRLCCK